MSPIDLIRQNPEMTPAEIVAAWEAQSPLWRVVPNREMAALIAKLKADYIIEAALLNREAPKEFLEGLTAFSRGLDRGLDVDFTVASDREAWFGVLSALLASEAITRDQFDALTAVASVPPPALTVEDVERIRLDDSREALRTLIREGSQRAEELLATDELPDWSTLAAAFAGGE